jgi:hypothetical protein
LETAIDRAMRINPAARFSSVRRLGAELLPHASPAVSAVWTPVFGDLPGDEPEDRMAKADVGGTANVTRSPVQAATTHQMGTGTMLLPVSREDCPTIEPSDEITDEPLQPPRSWMARWAVIGVALGLAVAAVVSGVRRAGAPVEPAEADPKSAPPAHLAPAAPAAPVGAAPAIPRLPAPVSLPPPVDEPPAVRAPRRGPTAAPRAPLIRRRKPRLVPPEAIDPLPEVRTNVPIPD